MYAFGDLELRHIRIFGEFRGISQILEATTARRMKIDPFLSDSVA